MSTSIGIDFGTTASSIAVMENGDPRIVPNARGLPTTPSAVGLTAKRKLSVGRRALAKKKVSPNHVVPAVKSILGRGVDDPVVERYRDLHEVDLVDVDGEIRAQLGEHDYSPEHLASALLAELRRAAERYLGEAVSGVVLTTPAFFTDPKRRALQEAAEGARLEVRRLVNSTTAVGIDHGRSGPAEATQAVVDLGGGCFDVTVLTRNRGVFEVEATAGTTSFGGWEFDRKVYEWLVESCRGAVERGADWGPTAHEQLLRRARAARCELSEAVRTWISVPKLAEQAREGHFPVELKRSTFESLVAEQVDEVESTCEKALQEADLDAAAIDELSIVGGLGETPVLRRRIEAVFDMEATDDDIAEGSAARGAAIQAGILAGDVEEFVMLDVTPMDIGLRIDEDGFLPVVPRNTPIPTRASGSVTTTRDGQTEVTIEVVQGNSDRASENRLLGMFTLTGIQKADAGVPEVEVTFNVDSDGRLDISAEEIETGRQQSMTVEGRSDVSEETIRASVDRFESEVTESDQSQNEKALADWIDGIEEESSGDWLHNPSTSVTTIEDEAFGAGRVEESDPLDDSDGLGKRSTVAKQDEASSESAPKSWRRRHEEEHDDRDSRDEIAENLRESQALRLNRKLENLEPPETWEEAQAYFSRGFRAHKNHDYAEALQYFTRAYRFDEDSALYKTYYAYVTFLSNPDELDRCKALLREAVAQHDPQVAPDAHFFLGRLLKAEEQDERAKHHFRKALDWDPDLEGAERELELYDRHQDGD